MKQANDFYRSEIDGLRAVAVLSVIAYHAFPELFPAGFLGVDIFFVISGFLITSVIASGISKSKFNILLFYSRRINRLFPALILVIIACFAFSWFALYSKEFASLGNHIFAAVGFFLNFVLWQESGYFDTQSMLKPLLHLWSLSVEIQFYIFWPLILLLTYQFKFNVVKVTMSVFCISLLLNLLFLEKDAIGAFFLSFNRFWEFQIGAMCALFIQQYSSFYERLSSKYSNYFISFSFAIFLLIAFMTPSYQIHSVLLTLLCTFASLSLILFSQNSMMAKKVLGNPLMVGIGIISYPLYLWHWPLISFGQIVTNGRLTPFYKCLLIFAAVVLAYLTYRFLERYVRYGSKKITFILLIILIFVASQGWSVYTRDGLNFREKHIKDSFGGRPPQVDQACLKLFGQYAPRFCRASDNAHLVEVLLIGDSIAHNNYEGLAASYKLEGKPFAMIGWPGQKPFIRGSADKPENESSELMHQLILGIQKDPNIKTVILAMRTSNISEPTLLLMQLKQTISELRAYGKELIFIYTPPEINFDPIECVGMPPFRPVLRESCSLAVKDIPPQFFQLRSQLNEMLNSNQVRTFDTYPMICQNNHCPVKFDDGNLLYRERGYLTTSGSIKVFKNFQDQIVQDKNPKM
jgi:peptidoglycan/LPS O-acetylase OafA/YrhL